MVIYFLYSSFLIFPLHSSNLEGYIEVTDFGETVKHRLKFSENKSLTHMGEWWDQVPLLCPNPEIPDGRPVEEVMSSTPVASPYKRPSGEVVFLDNSPSKRGFVTEFSGMSASSSSSSETVLAAAPNGSAETVVSAGDIEEDDSANTSGRGANKKNGRR